MKVHLFTVIKCTSCGAHKKEVIKTTSERNIPLAIIDVDDEKYLTMAMNAIRKYGISKTPSMVVLSDKDEVLAVIQGIKGSITKLESIINAKGT